MTNNKQQTRTLKLEIPVADRLKTLVPGGRDNTYSTVVDQLVEVAEVLRPHMKPEENYADTAKRFIQLVTGKKRVNRFKGGL